MTEPTVPVPVTLIERLIGAAYRDDLASVVEARALLSQPNLTAEQNPWPTEGRFEADGTYSSVDTLQRRWRPAEPPSIDTMAPGTTFTAILRGIEGGTGTRRRTFTRQPDSPYILFESESGGAYFPRDIDPSTIRDVTPPAGADAP